MSSAGPYAGPELVELLNANDIDFSGEHSVTRVNADGLSVLIWERIVGVELHWIVLAFAVIILLAVGSDYNLLLVSRFKEEIGAGIKTGIIRSMGSTGSVVTAAGLVFAFTMAAMVSSDLRNIGQGGTTIGLGLLFDTLIVRSLMTPSIAALLGRWFWWPLKAPPAQHTAANPGPPPPAVAHSREAQPGKGLAERHRAKSPWGAGPTRSEGSVTRRLSQT